MVVSKLLDQHITNSYGRWTDYAEYHAALAGIPDQAGDILNEVLLSLIQKDQVKLDRLLARKKGQFTELDFYVLRMIKLNTYSSTSPYRHKTKSVPVDANATPSDFNIKVLDRDPDSDQGESDEEILLKKSRMARKVLESLEIPDIDKKIFSWKFFGDNSLRSWPGEESYQVVCTTFNRVRRQMKAKIKNPHSSRKKWTEEEIRYLKAEYPHMETMSIAYYLGRNYNSVEHKARKLELKKSSFAKRKINRKCGRKTLWNPTNKGDSP